MRGRSTTSVPLVSERIEAAAATPQELLSVRNNPTSGTVANGFGAKTTTRLKSSVTSNQVAGEDDPTEWSDAADAARTAQRRMLLTRNAALVEVLRFDNLDSATQTNAWLLHNGSLKRVEVGAADSGGSGYRLLRIAN